MAKPILPSSSSPNPKPEEKQAATAKIVEMPKPFYPLSSNGHPGLPAHIREPKGQLSPYSD